MAPQMARNVRKLTTASGSSFLGFRRPPSRRRWGLFAAMIFLFWNVTLSRCAANIDSVSLCCATHHHFDLCFGCVRGQLADRSWSSLVVRDSARHPVGEMMPAFLDGTRPFCRTRRSVWIRKPGGWQDHARVRGGPEARDEARLRRRGLQEEAAAEHGLVAGPRGALQGPRRPLGRRQA